MIKIFFSTCYSMRLILAASLARFSMRFTAYGLKRQAGNVLLYQKHFTFF